MKVFRSLPAYRRYMARQKAKGLRIGFVPTMGALHRGHARLLERARRECDLVVLSIFVNPTQFNNPVDFKKYPVTLKEDLKLAREIGVDCVWLPGKEELYPDGYTYRVIETQESRDRCGAFRPGHFEGVLTVVMKLFQCTQPDRAYFGEKDFQQLELIEGMVRAFFLSVRVVRVPTVRDPDGLALSSRNLRLTPEERKRAALFPKILGSGKSVPQIQKALQKAGFRVEYVVKKRGRIFGAIQMGTKDRPVRLIDNFPCPEGKRGKSS